MKSINYLFLFVLMLVSNVGYTHETTVNKLMQKHLPNMSNQEGVMLIVSYAPGEKSDKHKHNAHVFVYVLEGSVIMQVKGGERVTLKTGETFYEAPDDIHTVSMNASSIEKATLLVFMVKEAGKPPTLPVKD